MYIRPTMRPSLDTRASFKNSTTHTHTHTQSIEHIHKLHSRERGREEGRERAMETWREGEGRERDARECEGSREKHRVSNLGGGIGVISEHEAHVAGHAGEGEMPEESTLHQPAGAAAY